MELGSNFIKASCSYKSILNTADWFVVVVLLPGPACDVLVQSTCAVGETSCGGYADVNTGTLTEASCCNASEACIAVAAAATAANSSPTMQCVAQSSVHACAGADETPCGASFSAVTSTSNADYIYFDNNVCCTAAQKCVQSVGMSAFEDRVRPYTSFSCQ